MSFRYFEAITICVIYFGCTFCYSALNGTTSGVKTILKGILFECSNKYIQKTKGDMNCEAYLAISIKTEPSLHTNKLHQFLTLDEIYVASRFSTARLVSPYVIEISRGKPLIMCPLEYDKSETAKELEKGFSAIGSNRYSKNRRQVTSRFLFAEKNPSNMQVNAKGNSYKGGQRYGYESTGDHGNGICKCARSYSVFNTNLPIPFLVTTVNIFQKRYSTWWKLAPSVTVDSYSGFYASGKLFVWLKYHVNIFQLSKSINRVKNVKLLMPTHNNTNEVDNLVNQESALIFYYLQNSLIEDDFKSNNLNSLENQGIVLKAAQGQYINETTFLENCSYNRSILCINIPDDVVGGYALKIHLPFVENAFVQPNVFKVKIINVITDATLKDTVKVSVNLVNEGFEVQEFAINIDCFERVRINQTYNIKTLLPHVSETMNFFLTFIRKKSEEASKKVYCKIQVKTRSKISTKRSWNQPKYVQMDAQSLKYQRTVATRKIAVMPRQRCLCVWKCSCHCLAKLEINNDNNACEQLDSSSQSKAGLLTNSNYYELNAKDFEDDNYNIQSFTSDCFWFAILIVIIMAFLGFCKATIGICIPFVAKWGYDYLQPGRNYADTSKIRHFLINLFYFIMLPFLMCCKCFMPSAEDLLISNSEDFMTKIYIHVYEAFYDNVPTVLIIEESATSLQTDEY